MPYITIRSGRGRSCFQQLPVEELLPGPLQPRRYFDPEALYELSESIAAYGLLHPLTVRRRGGGYELVAGARRLRAAKMAGLRVLPCMVLDADMEDAGLIALTENLQRRALGLREEAEGLERLIRLFGLSPGECARRIGLSPAAVEKKLRLLRLPPDVLDGLQAGGLSEQYGHCFLRLPDAASQRAALAQLLREGSAEDCAGAPPQERSRTRFVLKDLRVFLNTLSRGLELLRRGGVDARMEQQETEDSLILTVRISKIT